MTSNIKVVDVNEEAKQNAPEVKTEEVTQEVEETQNEVVNEVVNEPVREPVIEKKEELPKPETADNVRVETLQDKVRCPKCYREMTIKAFKYRHEKACQGKLSEKPVKPHTKPKAKPKPKLEQAKGFLGSDASSEASRDYRNTVRAEPIQEQTIEQNEVMSEKQITQKQQPQQQLPPANPLMSRMPREATAAASHYQLLQQQYMQQKQERFNNLFKGMVSGSRKKR